MLGCEFQTHENLFIVPNGYKGPLVVILVEGREPAFERVQAKNVYRFSSSGVLCVASFRNFTHGWGITRAAYANGTSIPLPEEEEFRDTRFSPSLQKWSALLSDAEGNTTVLSDPELLFVIGDSDDLQEITESWSSEEPRFKRELCSSQ